MLQAIELSKNYNGQTALDSLDLNIEAGEIFCLLGANGAGKSTLLKAMCGDVKPTGGEIYLENRRLSEWDYHELARKRAVLSQHSTLNFPFTAREVALLGRNPHIRGRESKKDLEIVREALQLVEAAHFANQSFPTLSGGEQQCVHLARVLAQIWERQTERYLLLDEPVASLDLAHQHLTLQTARKFARENTAVLCVLHDLNLAAGYADKIMILQNGRVFALGKPWEVLKSEIIREVFGIDAIVTKHPKLDIPLIVPIAINYEAEKISRQSFMAQA